MTYCGENKKYSNSDADPMPCASKRVGVLYLSSFYKHLITGVAFLGAAGVISMAMFLLVRVFSESTSLGSVSKDRDNNTAMTTAQQLPTEVVITSYGRYKDKDVARISLPDASGDCAILSTDQQHIETTGRIPCRIGEKWGFTFELRNLPTNRTVKYRSEMHHPPILQPDGEVLHKSVVRKTIRSKGVYSDSELWGFLRGYEYELVPGEWTRKIFIDDVEVVSMTFEVVSTVSDPKTSGTIAKPLILGIKYVNLSVDLLGGLKGPGRPQGVYVQEVFPGTPAFRTGLRRGDVITAFDGRKVVSRADLHEYIHQAAGHRVSIRLLREGEQREFRVVLGSGRN